MANFGGMKHLSFYFDYLSPFSYFAFLKLPQLQQSGVTCHLKPVPLGPLLNHWGIKGPGEVPPKREYLTKVCLRYAQKENLEFTTPPVHPFNSLYALRLSLLSVCQTAEQQYKVVDCIWKAGWQKRFDIGSPEILQSILDQAGLPAAELFERSFSSEARRELKSHLQSAITQGVFGVPSFMTATEVFWGLDSFQDLIAHLEDRDDYDPEKLHFLLSDTKRAMNQTLEIGSPQVKVEPRA
jgi:2-hydroxychromene-2-carboxylate isomerase